MDFIAKMQLPASKYHLHQQHIQNGSSADTKQRILFPFMQKDDKQNRNGFWQSVSSASRHILQAVYHQKPDYRIGKHIAKMADKFRWFLSFRKNKKGKKTGDHRSKNHAYNGDNSLCNCHCHAFFASFFFSSLRWISKHAIMETMAGMMK